MAACLVHQVLTGGLNVDTLYYEGQPIAAKDRAYVPPDAKDDMNLHAEFQEENPIPPYCNKDLPTLSVAKDRIIKAADWPKFVADTPIFILGVTDSDCRTCCNSEEVLFELEQLSNDGTLQWTKEKKKKGKTQLKSKPVPIVRIDTNDRAEVEAYRREGLVFAQVPKVFIGGHGVVRPVDMQFHFRLQPVLQMMQRMAEPVVTLTTQDEVLEFLDTQSETLWRQDYEVGGKGLYRHLDPAETTWRPENIDGAVQELGYNTRVVAFFYDEEEYEYEIGRYRYAAQHLSQRMNLRMAMVTNGKLIKQLKKDKPHLFFSVGLSCVVLNRYDNEQFKFDLSIEQEQKLDFTKWITSKSTKIVDELNNGAYQLMELAQRNMMILYVDFGSPEYGQASRDAVTELKKVAQPFEEHFKVFYDPHLQHQRKFLGITWDELPALAFNSLDHQTLAYPRGREITRDQLLIWFRSVQEGKVKPALQPKSDFVPPDVISDNTIFEFFMKESMQGVTSDTWDETVVDDNGIDSLLLVYSTETTSYSQRVLAYQFHLVSIELKNLGYLNKKIIVYAYDGYQNPYPKGIKEGSPAPHDLTGDLHGSPQLKNAGLPKIYFIGHDNKNIPFKQYSGTGQASSILDWVKQTSSHNLSKIDTDKLRKYNVDKGEYEAYGRRTIDNLDFFRIIKAEDIIRPTDPSTGNPIDFEDIPKVDDTEKTEL